MFLCSFFHDFRQSLIVIFHSHFLFCLQIKEMYEKTHAAIREDPERKPSDKEPFKGKRYVAFHLYSGRASSSYFFLFFPIFLSILLFFLFFSNFLLFFLFFCHFTYNKQIFIRDLNILSLFKYVVYRVH